MKGIEVIGLRGHHLLIKSLGLKQFPLLMQSQSLLEQDLRIVAKRNDRWTL
jgi:hypothetical protein